MGEIIEFRPKHSNSTGDERKKYIEGACFDVYFELSAIQGVSSTSLKNFLTMVKEKCLKLGFTEFTILDEATAMVYFRRHFVKSADDGLPDIEKK